MEKILSVINIIGYEGGFQVSSNGDVKNNSREIELFLVENLEKLLLQSYDSYEIKSGEHYVIVMHSKKEYKSGDGFDIRVGKVGEDDYIVDFLTDYIANYFSNGFSADEYLKVLEERYKVSDEELEEF